jgi:hypothetical protein
MNTEILTFAALLNSAAHILRSQMGRNAKGSIITNKQGFSQSDRFVKMTEFGGASDKTPKAVRDARTLVNSWAVISPQLPEYAAEVAKAQAALLEEEKAKSLKNASNATVADAAKKSA